MRLKDHVALVTGAGSGIGRAIALVLAREGARVVCADVDAAGLEETRSLADPYPGEVSWTLADMALSVQVQSMIDTVCQRHGRLDILVNNAGIGGSQEATVAHTTPEADWERIIAVNLTGVFLGCKYAIPIMLDQGGGRIVNIASVGGLVAVPGKAAYTTAKGGVVQLTRSLALDYAPYRIGVNAVCPGWVETNMTRRLLEQPEARQRLLAQLPWGRFGTPSDIAGAALFLAGPESEYVTGHTLVVDGGWTIQ